jgi:arsenate reductase (thioredoxin)
MKRVLILCTGNSCRSQMAEGLWNLLGQGQWSAVSAGSKPAGYVHPLAIVAMQELGIDLSAARSKHLEKFASDKFDLVVTVCDHARDACPVFPGALQTLHWPFHDPAEAGGTEVERLSCFRAVRDEIQQKISAWLESDAR